MSSVDKGSSNTFLFLNRDGRWADFQRRGLEIGADQSVSLTSLPSLETSPGWTGSPASTTTTANSPFGGIAAAPDGTIYFSDPFSHSLLRIDACDHRISLCRRADDADGPWYPSGLLWHRSTDRLFVADVLNHRVLVLDAAGCQVLDVWGAVGTVSPPASVPLPLPIALADDPDGNVYVVDYGRRRIEQFSARGNPLPGFWETVLRQQPHPRRPRLVAVAAAGSQSDRRTTEVFVVDRPRRSSAQALLFVFDGDGRLLRWGTIDAGLPCGLAVDANWLYLGDNESRQVVKYAGHFGGHVVPRVGVAAGFTGNVSALCLANDASGRVLINPSGGAVPASLTPRGAFIKAGWMAGGPFRNPSLRAEQWHRLRMELDTLDPSTHCAVVREDAANRISSSAGDRVHQSRPAAICSL